MTNEDYLNLITSEHRGKEKFEATVVAGVSPFSKLQEVMLGLPDDFDIDTATGVQLDAVGVWIGRSRRIDTPLTGIYFTWEGLLSEGWDAGSWKGEFDPDSGLVDLPDDAYRTLLKAKIAANNWDGSIPQAYDIWVRAFGAESILLIQDNQDMSMVVAIAGQRLDTIEQALLVNGYIPLKPEGVKVNYYAVVPSDGTLMAWDATPNAALAGWDSGQWATELIPA
jgi:hypothetical protein